MECPDDITACRFVERLAALTSLDALYTPSMPNFLQRAGAAAEGLFWSTLSGRCGDAFGTAFERLFRHAQGRGPGARRPACSTTPSTC